MWNGVLRVVAIKIHFLICFWSDHNNISISMANATLDVLYAGSLRLNISYFFFE